jgi:hypothetical protein
MDSLLKLTGKPVKNFSLLFISSLNQFSPQAYHRVCDNITNLLTIIKSKKGFIIGGFSDLPIGDSEYSKLSFIFSVTHLVCMPLKKESIATVNEPAYGPIFGRENDIRVCEKSIFSNHHIYVASYERVEVKGIPTRELLIGGIEDDLV